MPMPVTLSVGPEASPSVSMLFLKALQLPQHKAFRGGAGAKETSKGAPEDPELARSLLSGFQSNLRQGLSEKNHGHSHLQLL